VIGDVLSASDLLLAIVAVLFGIWHNDIHDALSLTLDRQADDRRPQRARIVAALGSKALPLALGAWATAIVFFPRTLTIIEVASACEVSRRCAYDDVQAVLLLTQGFVVILAIYVTGQVVALILKLLRS
jgi:hypothetical protein